ncbi:MAG: DUF6144 family protein [Candidatus Thorarchaeota archaeon]
MQEKEENVVYKFIEPVLVAQIRIHGYSSDLPVAFSKLQELVRNLVIGSPIVVHHWGVNDEHGHDMDVCVPIKKQVEERGVMITTLPAKDAMTMIHKGPYSDIGPSYSKISSHTYERGHPIAESSREIYHHLDVNHPEDTIIEIQTILHDWTQRYSAKLESVLGKTIKEEVLAPLNGLDVDSSADIRQKALCRSLDFLENLTDDDQQYEILSHCAHVFPVELIPPMRALLKSTGSVDKVIEAMLAKGGYYPKIINREGSIIFTEKSPANPTAFKDAQTDAHRKKAYCFCPLIRDYLDEVPQIFCICSAGWPKQLWEGIFEKPLKIEIVQSLTKGDDTCEFAIHIPPEIS